LNLLLMLSFASTLTSWECIIKTAEPILIPPINVTRVPSQPGGLKGANRSAPHVLLCTVNFRSHFLPQPSDLVKLFSLVQLLKESMTRGTGYGRARR
jgi:hypothetical protein